MVVAVAYAVSGIAFLVECYLVPRWIHDNWWLIKNYPVLEWRSLTSRWR